MGRKREKISLHGKTRHEPSDRHAERLETGRERVCERQYLAKTLMRAEAALAGDSDVAIFLAGLSSAWKEGEARPTHRKQPSAKHWWKLGGMRLPTRGLLLKGLDAKPTVMGNELMGRLAKRVPNVYASKAQL